jgi:NADPH:quinone reductase-like Zn-dependent oxidoreductase
MKLGGVASGFRFESFRFRAPRRGILGMIAAGEVESVGRNVTAFKVGDPVFGMSGFRAGTYAEGVLARGRACVLRPARPHTRRSRAVPYGGLIVLLYAPAQGWRGKGS